MSLQNLSPPRVCWFPTAYGVKRMLVHQISFEDRKLYIIGKLWSAKLKWWSKTDSTIRPLRDFYGTEAEARLFWAHYRERVITMRKNDLGRAQAAYDRALKLPA